MSLCTIVYSGHKQVTCLWTLVLLFSFLYLETLCDDEDIAFLYSETLCDDDVIAFLYLGTSSNSDAYHIPFCTYYLE